MLMILRQKAHFFLAAALILFGDYCMADENIDLEKQEEDSLIEWVNRTSEPDILGVGASKESGDEYWSVFVSVAEFVREEPLESEFRDVVSNALSNIEGVTSVQEEDREVWLVKGDVQGSELVLATVKALQSIYPKLKAYMEQL